LKGSANKITVYFAAVLLISVLTACGGNPQNSEVITTPLPPSATDAVTTAAVPEDTTTAYTPETTLPPVETTAVPAVTETTSTPETTAAPEQTTAPAHTTAPEPPAVETNYINPLTGLGAVNDLSGKRPIAVMVNNIKSSCPQEGISDADIMYECLAEGTITRLLFLYSDYENVGKIGSVRSARDYFIDFAQNHDAIFVHAGGSTYAYDEIENRVISSVDGVNSKYGVSFDPYFFRDKDRLATMSYEHTLMTNGSLIKSAIKVAKYRTDLNENFTSPLNFAEADENVLELSSTKAEHVIITYASTHFPQYVYSADSGKYLRYQFNGVAHIDGTNDKQLEFDNIIILSCTHQSLYDAEKRIAVGTTGEGSGYYISQGKAIEIKWSKADRDTPFVLTKADGTELTLNRGKTAINITSPQVFDNVVLNYLTD